MPLLLLWLRRWFLSGCEVDHLAEGIPVVASAHNYRRHVLPIHVASCFLFNFDGASSNYVVSILLISLREEDCVGRYLELWYGNRQKFLLHIVIVLHKEPEVLAGAEFVATNSTQLLRVESFCDPL